MAATGFPDRRIVVGLEALMALSITGGQQLITSDMQRAFRDATAQAKKQLDETGSLQGFSKEFTSSSAEGTVTIEISAIASALYEKSADGDDYFLAYKVTDKPYYSDGGVGISSGSSTTIVDGEGIEAFTGQALGIMSDMRWGTLIDGSVFDSSVERGEPISFPAKTG